MTNAEIICTYCLDDLFFNSVSAQWTNKLMKVITTFSHPNSCIVAGNCSPYPKYPSNTTQIITATNKYKRICP